MGIDQKVQMGMKIQNDFSIVYIASKNISDALRKYTSLLFSDTLTEEEHNILHKALNIIENVRQNHTTFKAESYYQQWGKEYDETTQKTKQ